MHAMCSPGGVRRALQAQLFSNIGCLSRWRPGCTVPVQQRRQPTLSPARPHRRAEHDLRLVCELTDHNCAVGWSSCIERSARGGILSILGKGQSDNTATGKGRVRTSPLT